MTSGNGIADRSTRALAGGLQTLQKRQGLVQVVAVCLRSRLVPRLPLLLIPGLEAFEPLQMDPDLLELSDQVPALAPTREPLFRRQLGRYRDRLADGILQ